MTNDALEELGRKMDALGLWELLKPFNYVVKPAGTVFPYFCSLLGGDGNPVKIRFLMIEGWQTFHDFVHTRVDRNYGYYSTPMELPHFELVVAKDGVFSVFRHDPGFMPRALTEAERPLVAKILWEAYGVMMRVESDRKLPLRFASEKSMFARVEEPAGTWSDRPLEIPEPRSYVENVSFPKSLLSKAKDVPFVQSETIELDLRLMPNLMTKEVRPRCAYQLTAIVSDTGARVISDRTSVTPDGGLKALWEGMPQRVLMRLVERGSIPGEIKVLSGRVFRLLRPLCIDLPFKLSLHDRLPLLEEAFRM